MRCRPAVNLPTDVPFWISRSAFFEHFDQADFLCREVRDVTDAYLSDWFWDKGGVRHFLLPPISVISGSTQFISGRHRTAVLLRHLERIPLSFDFRFIAEADKRWLHSVTDCAVDLTADIDLPDLPIRAKL